jgi:translation initiation factor 3 subunit K
LFIAGSKIFSDKGFKALFNLTLRILLYQGLKMSFEDFQRNVQINLIGVNRYNPQNIEMLEAYIDEQIANDKYDPEPNFTVLKLYQLNPDKWNAEVAAKIFLKTLMVLPQSDTVLAKCVIDSAKLEEPPVAEALSLSHLLETCQFPKFWETIREEPLAQKLSAFPGFENSIRNFITHVVSITYQNINKDTLRLILGISNDKDLRQHCQSVGWDMKSDGYVFVSNQEATVKTRNIEEKIELANIQDILKASGKHSEKTK